MLKLNEANWDRIARVVIGIILLFLGLTGAAAGVVGIVLDIVGAVLVLTGLVGFCPLYFLTKFSTKKS
jgi:hypothetical protein